VKTAPRLLALTFLATSLVAFGDDEPEAPAEPTLADPVLVGPRTGEERKKALQRGGGNSATEKSVNAALDWLARHALEGGGWDADGFPDECEEDAERCDGIGKGHHGEAVPCPFDGALSALAALAFLGHGHAPGTPDDPYADLVEKTLALLRGRSDTWTLPLATQAFAEAEALERKGRFTADVENGVRAILSRQQEDGAWGYVAPGRPGSDVPYTALCVQALVTAVDAGVALDDETRDGVLGYLATLEIDKKGRLAYLQAGRRYGYTPTSSNAHGGAAIRHLLGVGTGAPAHRKNMGLIARQKPVWKITFKTRKVPGRGKVPVQIGNLSMYQWWYGTIATFHAGGAAWSGWFGKAKSALVGHQEKKGCRRGSWDPEGTYERTTGGRLFATALGALILEQPYRHR